MKKTGKQESGNQKKTYYYLPTDQYGQPRGDIWPVVMTEEEYRNARSVCWIFDSYKAAVIRAMD